MGEELELCGLVYMRWMYLIERYLKTLKGFVQNKARSEGKMAEGYALEEALGFNTKYIHDFIATKRQVWDDKEKPHMNDEMLEGNGWPQIITTDLHDMAHSFVLQNVELMSPWRRLSILSSSKKHAI